MLVLKKVGLCASETNLSLIKINKANLDPHLHNKGIYLNRHFDSQLIE